MTIRPIRSTAEERDLSKPPGDGRLACRQEALHLRTP
jgi:hypothetical protein